MSKANASIKALRALVRNRGYPFDDLGQHFTDLSESILDDRLLGIICAAAVEEALRGLLVSSMKNGSNELFEINRPLCTFSAKITIAYSFALIDDDIRRNADYIREIRNAFSHRVAPIDFKTKEVVAVCKMLKVGKRAAAEIRDVDKNMKTRYFWSAFTTIGGILQAVGGDGTPAALP
jgi:hypothetical protein